MSDFLESGVVLYMDQIISVSRGVPASVEFNFIEVWDYKRALGDFFHPGGLHFIHVHPPGMLGYSGTDVNCLQGLTTAFGYPVKFSIVVFTDDSSGSYEHAVSSMTYRDAKMSLCEALPIPNAVLVCLKALSYGSAAKPAAEWTQSDLSSPVCLGDS